MLPLEFTKCPFSLDSVPGTHFSSISRLTILVAGVSAVIYIFLNWIRPSAGTHTSFREVDMSEGISYGGSGRSSPAYEKGDEKADIYTTQAAA